MAEFHILQHQVLFRECDATGQAHISSYFKWFEDARFSIAEESKIIKAILKKHGTLRVIFPVVHVKCQFYSPVQQGECVEIHTTLSLDANKRLRFNHEVYEKNTDRRIADGCTQVVVLEQESKNIQVLDEAIREYIQRYTSNYEEVEE